MNVDIIILAAGKGTRMQSPLPKVLQTLGHKSLLQHLVDTCADIKQSKLHIIVGDQKELVKKVTSVPKSTNWVNQKKQLGTGHAVKQALKQLRPNACCLVLYADGPLVTANTLKKLIKAAGKDNLSLLTFEPASPKGLGRIIRNDKKQIQKITEEKDASSQERLIKEVNSGILATSSKNFKTWLPKIKNKNVSKEYQLTDIIAFAVNDQKKINAINLGNTNELLAANDALELHNLEKIYQKNIAEKFIKKGVKFADINRVDFRGEVEIKAGTFVDNNVIFEGTVLIGKDCKIGSGSIIKNATLKDNVEIEPFTIIETSKVGTNAKIGPFAHVGPGTTLEDEAEIGNFVEVKRSVIGKKTKAKHLAYIGDGMVSDQVNIGAGTIFVNYDGKNKNKTIVGTKAFIGSNSSLVAPLKIGKNSMIGAGSVVTSDVPENKLALGRSRQKNIKRK